MKSLMGKEWNEKRLKELGTPGHEHQVQRGGGSPKRKTRRKWHKTRGAYEKAPRSHRG